MRHNLRAYLPLLPAILMTTLVPQLSHAGTATVTAHFPAGQAKTRVPDIPTPAGTPQTVFTHYSNNYNYVTYPFTVTETGTYTATSTTTDQTNTTWFLTGLFSPGQPPSTPIGNVFYGVFAGGSTPYTANLPAVPLTAGQQYTILVAFNIGATPSALSTVTMAGPGCIAIGGNTCTAPVPALSPWALCALTAMLAAMGGLYLRRTRRA